MKFDIEKIFWSNYIKKVLILYNLDIHCMCIHIPLHILYEIKVIMWNCSLFEHFYDFKISLLFKRFWTCFKCEAMSKKCLYRIFVT